MGEKGTIENMAMLTVEGEGPDRTYTLTYPHVHTPTHTGPGEVVCEECGKPCGFGGER